MVKVRCRTYKSGKVVYQADLGEVDGKRVQKSFATKREAEEHVAKAKKARSRHGERAFALSSVEMADVVLARERLAVAGVTLTEAVDFYLRHAAVVKERVLLSELVSRFIRSREDTGRSDAYVSQLKVSLKAFALALPLTHVTDVTRADVQRWLASGGWSMRTRNNYLGDVRAMFAWAVKEGLAMRSPCEGLAKATLPESEISVLSVEDCEVLLQAARGDSEVMWYVVLGMFGGLRPAEIERMKVSAVNVDEGTVIVAAATAKTGSRRVVELPENARAWLRSVEAPERVVCGRNWTERWQTVRRACGWATGEDGQRPRCGRDRREVEKTPVTRGVWPKNVLRHTFASMHYAMHQDESLLKAQMGHWERTATLHRHYRALKTKAEAVRFWELRPEGEAEGTREKGEGISS